MQSPNLIEMKQSDIAKLREKIWLENDKKCPVLGKEIELSKTALDHAHKLKAEEPAIDKGTIRNTLEFRCNAICGKIENAFKRFGLNKEIDIVTFLRNAANYFEKGSYSDENGYYIHPSEVPDRRKKLSKNSFNKLIKAQLKDPKCKKPSKFPSSGYFTSALEKQFIKYNIEPEFLK